MVTKSAAVAGRRGFAGRPAARRSRRAGQHPVRREALDRERSGHADARGVLVGLVVEQLGVGVAADGGVDLRARHALADVGVVGDRLQRDVRDALVDEALRTSCEWAEAAGGTPGQLGLPLRAFGRVGEQVVREACAHEASAGEGERHAARVDRDPAPAPLLGHIGRRAAPARRVEDQVAGVGGHQQHRSMTVVAV